MTANAPDMAELAEAIGGIPPEEFGALTAAERSELAARVQRAAAARDALLDRAIDDSLRYIPALMRGSVKRALGV